MDFITNEYIMKTECVQRFIIWTALIHISFSQHWRSCFLPPLTLSFFHSLSMYKIKYQVWVGGSSRGTNNAITRNSCIWFTLGCLPRGFIKFLSHFISNKAIISSYSTSFSIVAYFQILYIRSYVGDGVYCLCLNYRIYILHKPCLQQFYFLLLIISYMSVYTGNWGQCFTV